MSINENLKYQFLEFYIISTSVIKTYQLLHKMLISDIHRLNHRNFKVLFLPYFMYFTVKGRENYQREKIIYRENSAICWFTLLNAQNIQDWAIANQDTGTGVCFFHMGGRDPIIKAKKLKWEIELVFTPVIPMWVVVNNQHLNCYIKCLL